jgi:hypothetical protein
MKEFENSEKMFSDNIKGFFGAFKCTDLKTNCKSKTEEGKDRIMFKHLESFPFG